MLVPIPVDLKSRYSESETSIVKASNAEWLLHPRADYKMIFSVLPSLLSKNPEALEKMLSAAT